MTITPLHPVPAEIAHPGTASVVRRGTPPGRSAARRRPDLALSDPLPDCLRIEPWTDDGDGTDHGPRACHDPRSWYVETFWLPVLGPSTVFLLRAVAHRFEAEPAGFDLDLDLTARALGLGGRPGRHAPLPRTIRRTVVFGVARPLGPERLAVRRRMPALAERHLVRLPEVLRDRHARWEEEQAHLDGNALARLRSRARRLAAGLAELGEPADEVESQLLRWRFHPALAHEATTWVLGGGRNPESRPRP